MIRPRMPVRPEIERFIASQQEMPFSYSPVGGTRTGPPRGYVVDRNRVLLGYGRETFRRAREAVLGWQMFSIPWLQLCWHDAPIAPGSTVAVLVRIAGLWWANSSRIVYVLEEQGEVRRFGFAYGTLPGHAERGEERFTVEWNQDDDSVWYDILAFSRPHGLLVRIGRPLARRLQKRFAQDSLRAMVRAVSAGGSR